MVTDREMTRFDHAVVHELAALVFLDVVDLEHAVAADDLTVVGDLAAHLGIHYSLIENDYRFGTGGDLLLHLILGDDGEYLRFGLLPVVADKLSFRHFLTEVYARPAEIAESLSRLSRSDALLLHECLESILIDGHALIGAHLYRQVKREAVGIIELECVSTGENVLALCLMLCKKLREDSHTGVDSAGKVLFLGLYDAGDVCLLLAKLGVLALVLMDDGVNDLIKERLIDAEELAVARCAAEQTAQDIAATLVGRQDAVADHKGGASDMVGDDAQGDVHLMALAVVSAGQLADLMGDVHNGIDIKEGVNALADNCQTLKTHAGVDILLLELGIVTLAVIVELGENVVPDLHVTVAVTADGAAGLAAAILRAAVIVYLGAGTAGTCSVLPEVVLLAEAEDTLGGDADLLVPNLKGLVVINIDGRIETVGIDADPVGRGQELPAPCDGFMLEVIAEGEVAEHFKISAVAGGLADVLDIAGTDALLAGADTAARRLLLALEIGLHRCHAGVYEQKACVVLRDEGEAGQAEMTLGFKKAQKHLTQLVKAEFFHFIYPPYYCFSFSRRSFLPPHRRRKALSFYSSGSGVSSR